MDLISKNKLKDIEKDVFVTRATATNIHYF